MSARILQISLTALVICASLSAYAQDEIAVDASGQHEVPAELSIAYLPDAPVQLDGRANEAIWERATPIDGFSVYSPTTGLDSRFDTAGRMFITDDALYFLMTVNIGDDDIYAPVQGRDSWPSGDYVHIQVDPYGTGRRASSFIVSASGVLRDAALDAGETQGDRAWDSLFDAATDVGPTSWSAEIRIPFQSLRFDPDVDTWGVHVWVTSWRHQQSISWAPIDRDNGNWLTLMKRVSGMSGLEPGRAIELLPSLTFGFERTADGVPDCDYGADVGSFTFCGHDLDYGLGFKWGITPQLTLDAVFHPDFSQIEADPAQLTVNNRFALFLGERRPFFLEGRGIFESPIDVVYTRSINQPLFALKLTGAEGPYRLGLLVAYDEEPPDSVADPGFDPSSQLNDADSGDADVDTITSILRLQRDFGSDATLGLFAISRNYLLDGIGGAADNEVFGVDGQFDFTPQLGGNAAFFMTLADDFEGVERAGYGGRAHLQYERDNWQFLTRYVRITEDFRAESGFVPRLGYHQIFAKTDFFYRSESTLRFWSPGVWSEAYLDDDLDVTERTVNVNSYMELGNSENSFTIYPSLDFYGERVDNQWLSGNVLRLQAGWDSGRWLELWLSWRVGDAVIRDSGITGDQPAFLGWSSTPGVWADFRLTPSLLLAASYQHRLLYRDSSGDLLSTQPIVRATAQYYLTRDLNVRNIVEWSRAETFGGGEPSARFSNDLLLSYQPSPGTVFFLGYREAADLEPVAGLSRRLFFAKFSYLFVM